MFKNLEQYSIFQRLKYTALLQFEMLHQTYKEYLTREELANLFVEACIGQMIQASQQDGFALQPLTPDRLERLEGIAKETRALAESNASTDDGAKALAKVELDAYQQLTLFAQLEQQIHVPSGSRIH